MVVGDPGSRRHEHAAARRSCRTRGLLCHSTLELCQSRIESRKTAGHESRIVNAAATALALSLPSIADLVTAVLLRTLRVLLGVVKVLLGVVRCCLRVPQVLFAPGAPWPARPATCL